MIASFATPTRKCDLVRFKSMADWKSIVLDLQVSVPWLEDPETQKPLAWESTFKLNCKVVVALIVAPSASIIHADSRAADRA